MWCKNCHRQIIEPEFLKTANVKGKINLQCGYCKVKNIIKSKQNDDIKQSTK